MPVSLGPAISKPQLSHTIFLISLQCVVTVVNVSDQLAYLV